MFAFPNDDFEDSDEATTFKIIQEIFLEYNDLLLDSLPPSTIQEICASFERFEVGDSSSQTPISCQICFDTKHHDEIFKIKNCSHSFCMDCMGHYINTKFQENPNRISCPNMECMKKGSNDIELEDFRGGLLPKELIEKWDEARLEASIPESKKYYCPFNDCSALMEYDDEGDLIIMESECPVCHRLFCVVCGVAWHAGLDCEEFQGLNEDKKGKYDLMLMELAKENKWMPCPGCKFHVEKIDGCKHISCRCGFQFCYECGSEWIGDHENCPEA
ncbi:hypothetical protein UlMin_010329 [Ulmus minor]